MKKNSIFIMILVIMGIIMLFGSSYSLIMSEINPKYSFIINDFDKEYLDSYKISLKEKEKINEIEMTLSVKNNTNNIVNYRLDLLNNLNIDVNKDIFYSFEINGVVNNYNLFDNTTLVQNKKLDVNNVDDYKIKITYKNNKRISLNLNLDVTFDDNKYLVNTIKEMEDNFFNADSIRYNGGTYNNYVSFNCNDENCELWRIIGVFNKKNNYSYNTLPSIKLIKDSPIDKINYNNGELNGNYDKSYINTYLNGAYYENIDNKSKNLIINTEWNIGNISTIGLFEDEEIKNKFVTRIGLLNVSDYLYLKDNSWLNLDNAVFLNKINNNVLIFDKGIKESDGSKEYNIYPCVYIRGDVSVISGDGTLNDPYVIDILYPLNYGFENEES